MNLERKENNENLFLSIQVVATPGQFKSLPRDFVDNKYQLTYGLESSPNLSKRRPPSPPRRQSSRDMGTNVGGGNNVGDVVIDCSGPVPTATCDDRSFFFKVDVIKHRCSGLDVFDVLRFFSDV